MSQAVRDHVGALLLRLTLKELFDWHFMQVVMMCEHVWMLPASLAVM